MALHAVKENHNDHFMCCEYKSMPTHFQSEIYTSRIEFFGETPRWGLENEFTVGKDFVCYVHIACSMLMLVVRCSMLMIDEAAILKHDQQRTLIKLASEPWIS